MPEIKYFFQSLVQQGKLSGSRSTVLQPFYWIIGILSMGLFSALKANAPFWILVSIVVGLLLSIFCFLGAYIYCLIKDRDALRSERYNVTKMAIEHSITGDDAIGLIELQDREEGTKVIEPVEKLSK